MHTAIIFLHTMPSRLSFLPALVATAMAASPSSQQWCEDERRSWQDVIQNINGLTSILTLLPVLTGKSQNTKLVASRIFPASCVWAGTGAGRVLGKLQIGILLWSFELYRNTIDTFSTGHDEYVNQFAPSLRHLATNVPERHTTGSIENHNPAETYMVEAWFRSKGAAAVVELKQTNNIRMAVGLAIYLMLYAAEMFISVRNAALGSTTFFIAIQTVSTITWMTGIVIAQRKRGQSRKELRLNVSGSAEHRHFLLPISGDHVLSVPLSFHLSNLQEYALFKDGYSQPLLSVAGALIVLSAFLDIVSTVLIVGLTKWAYPWIGIEIAFFIIKGVFCLEPLRHTEIKSVTFLSNPNSEINNAKRPPGQRLPLTANTISSLTCTAICSEYTLLQEPATGLRWRSTSTGVWIGQEYILETTDSHKQHSKYLTTTTENRVELTDDPLPRQDKDVMQREFLAALQVIMQSNKVPSKEFVQAVEVAVEGAKGTMDPIWFNYGCKGVLDQISRAKHNLRWRTYL